MQEEVTQKTIALSVNVGKGAARLTEQALQKAIQKFLEQRKSHTPHGKQTMRQLMKQNAGVSNIEITDSNIKAFESTAKKYNIDFSLKKVKGEQTRYLVFFKGRDADVMTAAFKEFSAKKLTQEKKPSIRKLLSSLKEKAAGLNAQRDKVKNKDREVSL
ncbi:PcfB family protein [Candidatus Agathobaculum pullicola]|uniref:PcfB family protein n=1 Tax=Candidatus Agathobaculum pullicola TaxID=2838426 RepID=UPI003F925A8B